MIQQYMHIFTFAFDSVHLCCKIFHLYCTYILVFWIVSQRWFILVCYKGSWTGNTSFLFISFLNDTNLLVAYDFGRIKHFHAVEVDCPFVEKILIEQLLMDLQYITCTSRCKGLAHFSPQLKKIMTRSFSGYFCSSNPY